MRLGVLNPTLCILLAGLAFGSSAQAWGPEGHAIIAEIAEVRLQPVTRLHMAELLALEGHEHLDQIASWADAYHVDQQVTGPWHYVNIPDASAYNAARDCPANDCVVGRLIEIAGGLGDRNLAPAERLVALKFVVHFVGDIHQPLHASDPRDRGGNDLKLVYRGTPTNLHALWDQGIIETELGTRLGPNWLPDLTATATEARRLDEKITIADATAWAPRHSLDAAIVGWANESHAASGHAYADLPADHPAGWETAYEREEWPAIETQLERAGVRLATVLNIELGR